METIKKGLVVNKEFDNMFGANIDKDIARGRLIYRYENQLKNCTNKLFIANKELYELLDDENLLFHEVGATVIFNVNHVSLSKDFCLRHDVLGLVTVEKARRLFDVVNSKKVKVLKISNSLYGEYNNLTSKLKALKEI